MNGTPTRFGRRRFLEIVGVAGGAVALREGLWPLVARAQTAPPPGLLLTVYFSGGWDQLLALDPRPNDVYTAANATTTRILPGYDLCRDTQVASVLGTNPSGVQTQGNLTFGPAVPPSLFQQHGADLCLFRGLTMNTLTHEVGRRYFITGKFPRGLVASGSSITTIVADKLGAARDLPNLAISSEAYNEGLDAYASAISVGSASDVQAVLRPLGMQLTADTDSALEEFENEALRCSEERLDGSGKATLFRAGRTKAREMLLSKKYNLFNFSLNASYPPPPEVQTLFSNMQISTYSDLAGPKGKAALAAHALAQGVSQAVAVQLVSGIDDHYDWDLSHATDLRMGFDALGLLISHLKATAAPNGMAGTVWDNTTLLCFSEFSRTPLINGRNGRDHHLTASCLVAGPGIKGNTVIGKSTDVGMLPQPIDPATGQPSTSASAITARPADVHATILQSMGIDWKPYILNQSPVVLSAALKG